MNLERFTLIVESYGADSHRWPVDERAKALEFSLTSPDALSLLDQAAALDHDLALFELPDSARSVRRVEMAHTLWRPTLVACLPLLLGVVIGLTLTNNTDELSLDEELGLLAFTDIVREEWNNE